MKNLFIQLLLKIYGRNCKHGTPQNKNCNWQRQLDGIKGNRRGKPVPMQVYKCRNCGEMVSF